MGSYCHFLNCVDQLPFKGDLAPNCAQSQTSPGQCEIKWPQEVWRQLRFNQVNCRILTWSVPAWKDGSLPFLIESPRFVN